MVELCALITGSGKSLEQIREIISKASGGVYTISVSTMSNWMSGKTKRPSNYTMTWVGYALGVRRTWEPF